MMKRYIVLLVLLILGVGCALILHAQKIINLRNVYYFSVCDTPITYVIDTVDPQFHVSKEELLDATTEAAKLWNKAMNQQLFVYDSDGKVKVRLSYDSRTGMSTEINDLENELDAKKDTIDPTINEYKKRLHEYEQKLDALNSEIASWNDRGGAPPEVFDRLTRDQQALKQEATTLQEMANNLNQSTEKFNQNVQDLNQKVTNFNEALVDRPEEGVYDPADDTITVYFNNNRDELVRTLAHELGHARGLDHINNPDSIMYFQTNLSTKLSSEDIAEITRVCAERTRLSVVQERFQLLFQLISQRFGMKS